MAFTYSVMLDLTERNVLVVGAGKVAVRKVKRLLKSGAKITVVAPNSSEDLLALAQCQMIAYIKRPFDLKDIVELEPFLVFAATDNPVLNETIAQYCATNNILVNAITDPINGNFSVQAEIKKRNYAISISTFGHGPGFSKAMREYLEPVLDDRLDLAVDVYIGIRQWLFETQDNTDLRIACMRRLTLKEICSMIDEGTTNYDELLEKVKEWLFCSLD